MSRYLVGVRFRKDYPLILLPPAKFGADRLVPEGFRLESLLILGISTFRNEPDVNLPLVAETLDLFMVMAV